MPLARSRKPRRVFSPARARGRTYAVRVTRPPRRALTVRDGLERRALFAATSQSSVTPSSVAASALAAKEGNCRQKGLCAPHFASLASNVRWCGRRPVRLSANGSPVLDVAALAWLALIHAAAAQRALDASSVSRRRRLPPAPSLHARPSVGPCASHARPQHSSAPALLRAQSFGSWPRWPFQMVITLSTSRCSSTSK